MVRRTQTLSLFSINKSLVIVSYYVTVQKQYWELGAVFHTTVLYVAYFSKSRCKIEKATVPQYSRFNSPTVVVSAELKYRTQRPYTQCHYQGMAGYNIRVTQVGLVWLGKKFGSFLQLCVTLVRDVKKRAVRCLRAIIFPHKQHEDRLSTTVKTPSLISNL